MLRERLAVMERAREKRQRRQKKQSPPSPGPRRFSPLLAWGSLAVGAAVLTARTIYRWVLRRKPA